MAEKADAGRFKTKEKEAEMKAWREFDERAERLVSLIEKGGGEAAIKDAGEEFRKSLAAYKEASRKKE